MIRAISSPALHHRVRPSKASDSAHKYAITGWPSLDASLEPPNLDPLQERKQPFRDYHQGASGRKHPKDLLYVEGVVYGEVHLLFGGASPRSLCR